MPHSVIIYYIAHSNIPENPACCDPFTSDEESSFLTGSGGAMRSAGHPLSHKYLLRRYASHLLLNRVFGLTSSRQLVAGPHGKPDFSDSFPPASAFSFFNLSHGRDYTVMAVSDAVLGIDIQEIPDEKDPMKKEKGEKKRSLVADRSFPEDYRRAYQIASREEEAAIFTRLWTKTEAILKAEGSGFACDLRDHPELLLRWKTRSFSLNNHEITVAMQDDFTLEMHEIF